MGISFDKFDGVIWYDGKLVPWTEATLHVLSHGLHYASAVFEGERAYQGRIFRLRDHTERLIRSGRILGFEIPWTAEQIDAACDETIAKNGLTNAYVRPIAWRGAEEMGIAAQATKVHMAIAVWEWGAYFGVERRMQGVHLAMAKWRRPHPETAPTAAKAAGLYMIGTLSKHAAMDEGADDAMMLDWKGDVAEATGANVFLAIAGKLHYTPQRFDYGFDQFWSFSAEGPTPDLGYMAYLRRKHGSPAKWPIVEGTCPWPDDPLGREIKLAGTPFRVVGASASRAMP